MRSDNPTPEPDFFASLPLAGGCPAPKLTYFERVLVTSDDPRHGDYLGEQGTVLCLDSCYALRRRLPRPEWLYAVNLSARGCCPTFFESALRSLGSFDPPSAHLGDRPEVSFDVVLEEDNDWAEGCYRLPGRPWEVVMFRKVDVPQIEYRPDRWPKPTPWEREATGMIFRLPQRAKVDRDYLLRALSLAFDHETWFEVQGPDSMMLR